MDIQLKQRLVGAVVLISLAVIIIPNILDERTSTGSDKSVTEIEIKPVPEEKFSSQVIPLDGTKNKSLVPIEKTVKQSIKPAPSKTGTVSWTIQVAVLSNEKSASALVNKLKKKGFIATQEKMDGSNGIRYRVRVGPIYNYEEIKKLKRKIDRETGLKGLIVRHP